MLGSSQPRAPGTGWGTVYPNGESTRLVDIGRPRFPVCTLPSLLYDLR